MENINAYKALAFFDLDGTLLNSQSQLDTDVIDAIHEIRRNGVLPFIATGRGHFELDNIMEGYWHHRCCCYEWTVYCFRWSNDIQGSYFN